MYVWKKLSWLSKITGELFLIIVTQEGMIDIKTSAHHLEAKKPIKC